MELSVEIQVESHRPPDHNRRQMFSWIFVAVNAGIIATYIYLHFRKGSRGAWILPRSFARSSEDGVIQGLHSESSHLSNLAMISRVTVRGVFMFNGHSFNAFEILDISPVKIEEMTDEQFQTWQQNQLQDIQRRESSQHEFFRAAIRSLDKIGG